MDIQKKRLLARNAINLVVFAVAWLAVYYFNRNGKDILASLVVFVALAIVLINGTFLETVRYLYKKHLK